MVRFHLEGLPRFITGEILDLSFRSDLLRLLLIYFSMPMSTIQESSEDSTSSVLTDGFHRNLDHFLYRSVVPETTTKLVHFIKQRASLLLDR